LTHTCRWRRRWPRRCSHPPTRRSRLCPQIRCVGVLHPTSRRWSLVMVCGCRPLTPGKGGGGAFAEPFDALHMCVRTSDERSGTNTQCTVFTLVRMYLNTQRETNGRTYYEFEFTSVNSRYTRHSLAVVAALNGAWLGRGVRHEGMGCEGSLHGGRQTHTEHLVLQHQTHPPCLCPCIKPPDFFHPAQHRQVLHAHHGCE